MSCSPENRDRIFAVLCEYAADSYVNGDSEERFLNWERSEICTQIEAAGFITRRSQTVHFRYSVFHQFFMACYLSGLSAEQLNIWMDAHKSDKRYDESICYLAGILANHCSQNWILDYLEQNNLRLYVKALAYGRNYAASEVNINFEYACHSLRVF